MKQKHRSWILTGVLAAGLAYFLAAPAAPEAQAQQDSGGQIFPNDLQQTTLNSVPDSASVYYMSQWPDWPPTPAGILASTPDLPLYWSPSLHAAFADDRSSVASRLLMQAADAGIPDPGDGSDDGSGDGGSSSTNSFTRYVFDTNGLWLEITNVSGGLAYLNLHNPTNQVYAIWSTTNLLLGWNVETEVWPTDTNCTPFAVPTLDRQNLFMLAEDWTGVTENGSTAPCWWFWLYFGTTALSDTNLDSQGNTLLFLNFEF